MSFRSPWAERLRALQAGDPDCTARPGAVGDAASWFSCAVGERVLRDPRVAYLMTVSSGGIGLPMDPDLERLGLDFYDQVRVGHYEKAEQTLALVQARVDHLARLGGEQRRDGVTPEEARQLAAARSIREEHAILRQMVALRGGD